MVRCRRVFLRHRRAAVAIQAAARGAAARRRYAQLVREHQAATVIQARQRGRAARADYRRSRDAVVAIQMAQRRWKVLAAASATAVTQVSAPTVACCVGVMVNIHDSGRCKTRGTGTSRVASGTSVVQATDGVLLPTLACAHGDLLMTVPYVLRAGAEAGPDAVGREAATGDGGGAHRGGRGGGGAEVRGHQGPFRPGRGRHHRRPQPVAAAQRRHCVLAGVAARSEPQRKWCSLNTSSSRHVIHSAWHMSDTASDSSCLEASALLQKHQLWMTSWPTD